MLGMIALGYTAVAAIFYGVCSARATRIDAPSTQAEVFVLFSEVEQKAA